MEKIYTVHLEETELEMLLAMCRRSLRKTSDRGRKRMLGALCDNLDATLMADMLEQAFKNIEALNASLEEHKKAEKRKHLRVVD